MIMSLPSDGPVGRSTKRRESPPGSGRFHRHFVDDPAFYEGAIAMLTDTLTRRLRGTAA